jgi:hypothetical protein
LAPGSQTICVDTGASACISDHKHDFVTLDTYGSAFIEGIGSGLKIAGTGTLRWILLDDDGQEITLFVRDILYMPAVPMCLLCPKQIAQQTRKTNDGFLVAGPQGTLIIDGFIETIPYSS